MNGQHLNSIFVDHSKCPELGMHIMDLYELESSFNSVVQQKQIIYTMGLRITYWNIYVLRKIVLTCGTRGALLKAVVFHSIEWKKHKT